MSVKFKVRLVEEEFQTHEVATVSEAVVKAYERAERGFVPDQVWWDDPESGTYMRADLFGRCGGCQVPLMMVYEGHDELEDAEPLPPHWNGYSDRCGECRAKARGLDGPA